MDLQKIIHLPEAFLSLLKHMSIAERVSTISALILMIEVFYLFIISPIIFNYILIPNIEHKIGKKLGHHPLIDYV